MGRLVAWILLTLALIALDAYRRKDLRKSLIALGSFALILGFAAMGLNMRAILPLFVAHILLILFAWSALLYYLLRGRYYWWAFWLPALSLALFVGLNFLEGSRYE